LRGERTLVGGRLPEGAVAAEVLTAGGERVGAAVGGGAWAALLDEPLTAGLDPVVRFADAAGATVRRPLPHGWPREPVDDADVACPACGGRAWELVTAHDARQAVVCRACGHEDPLGSVLTVGSQAERDEEAERLAREHERETRRLVLADLRVPVLAPVGAAPLELRGWGGGVGRGTERISVRRGAVEVETADEPRRWEGDDGVLREALAALLHAVEPGAGSAAAFVLRVRAAERAAVRAAARAVRDDIALRVDRHAQRFVLLRAEGAWVALLRRSGLRVVVSARGIEPARVALEHVDPVMLQG